MTDQKTEQKPDHEKRIREALEAGPTEGPWATEVDDTNPNEINIVSNNRPYVATAWPADASNDREQEANAAYIAACNPAAIRALLADLDAVRGALEELSSMYAQTWDKVDGGLAMFSDSVKRFEKAHARAAAALKGATA